MGGKEAGSVTNPLFESMEGMLRQLSQGSGAAGKSGAEVKVWGGAFLPQTSSRREGRKCEELLHM